ESGSGGGGRGVSRSLDTPPGVARGSGGQAGVLGSRDGWLGVSRRSSGALGRPGQTGAAPRAARGGVGVGPARLTQRGRIVLIGFAAVLVGLFGLAVARGADATSGKAPSTRAYDSHRSQVVVAPGQTLWSVAVHAEPDADP